ncbi:putative RNA-directed DNA polymerase [Tanacetum coccineum]
MAAITINSLDAGNPLFLHNNDHSNLPIVCFKLIGSENYKMWYTAMKIALKGKYKMGFIDGTCVKPATSHVLAQQWESCNAIVLEFDILSLLPSCTCSAHEGLLKHNQLVRLMQFLIGLNDVYQPIRSNLLAKDPLPDVKDAFVVVVREESHRGLAPGKISAKTNPAAFVAKTNNGNNNFNNNRMVNSNNNSNRGPNPNLVCKHYGLIGHTIERCYELNGYPAGFKRNPNLSKQSGFVKKFNGNNVDASQSGSTSSGSMTASFTNDQMIKLLSLINEKPATNVSGSMADMTVSTQTMFNVVDISSLQLSVSHLNGTMAKITTIGSLRLTKHVVLFDVLVIPEYTVNLLSVNKMIKDSKSFIGFHKSKCYIRDLRLGKIVETGSETAGLYMLDCVNSGKSFASLYNSGTVCFVSKELWHCRVGHPADQVLSVLSDKISFKTGDHVSACDICHKAKQTMEPFPLSDHKSVKLGELIHLDVWGPYKVISRDGYKYFLTVLDDFSRAVWVYLLKNKFEVFEYIESFIKMIFTQFGVNIKILRSDNGTEFVNNKMAVLFTSLGIIHQTSYSYIPQQNGITKRKNRHLLNVARSILFQGGIPLSMWPECVLTATYLINRLPSSVLSGASPFKIVYGKEHILSHLRAFGCLCYSTVLNNNDIFGSRSEKDVRFYETVFPFKMQDLSKERCVTDDTSAEVDPDIAYDVHYLSQHMHAPLQSHFNARLRVLRYLKQAPGTRVQFDKGNMFRLHAFLDADWAKCLKTRKSVSGFSFSDPLMSVLSALTYHYSGKEAWELWLSKSCYTINSLDVCNPLFLHNNDHSNLPIVGFKLIGSENYKMWSTTMKIALKGKYKMGFIDVTCVKPATSPVLAQQWEIDVLAIFLDELEETYDKMDGSVIFNVVQKINGLKQGDLFGLLKHNQLVRLMQFLMGLNDVYQAIRSNLLARDPLPDVKDAFAVVVREESHRGLAPDFRLGKIVGTGSETAGLYMFDCLNSSKSFAVGKGFGLRDEPQTEVRRSSRPKSQPVRFNDYVVSSNVKYGLEKFVCYSKLSSVNYCFSTILNKSMEPKPDIAYDVHYLSQHMYAPLQSHFNAELRVLRYLKQAPDVFTKGLSVTQHAEFCKRLGLIDMFKP